MKRSSRPEENHPAYRVFRAGITAEKADLDILILASQGIDTRTVNTGNLFDILVRPPQLEKARQAVRAYERENEKPACQPLPEALPLSSFKSMTAFSIMGLLTVIHILCHICQVREQAILTYGASALYILQGETYRAVTALFLHADTRHLLGNLAGMLLFAAPVMSLSGCGTGPFILLFTGTLGNLCNAWLYRTAHLSIGASTAVMGAAGLLAAYQAIRKRSFQCNTLVPIAAGAVLVGLFSHGDRTDVWAHIFGFLSGLACGILFFPLNQTLDFKYKDRLFLALSVLILLSALLAGTS